MRKNFQKQRYQNHNDGNVHNSNNVGPNVDAQYYNIPNATIQNGDCVVCKRTAVCVCQRCGDFYCSPDCQKNDWQKHRYICFPMPNLVRFSLYNSGNSNSSSSFADSNNVNTSMPKLAPNHSAGNVEKCPEMSKSDNTNPHQQPSGKKYSPGPQNKPATNTRNSFTCTQPPISPIPKNNSRILLVGFRSPNRCYIRSSADADNSMFAAKTIDSYGKTAPPLTKLPQVNSYAISHLDRSGLMYRVQVLAIQGDKIRVLFLDTGATAVRQMSELREISEEILKLRQYSVQVQLRNVENYEMDSSFNNFLSQFEDRDYKVQVFKDAIVTLYDWQNGSCLNDQIIKYASQKNASKHNYTSAEGAKQSNENKIYDNVGKNPENNNQIGDTPKLQEKKKGNNDGTVNTPPVTNVIQEKTSFGSPPKCEPVLIAPFETRILEENMENLDVVVVDNSCLNLGFFACITRSDIQNFAALQEYLAAFKDTGKEYKPILNEFCLAKFEGDWYRAKVTTIQTENRFTVFYIDYTNESTVCAADIRPYPSDLRLACTTSMCLIEGLPNDISESIHKYIKTQIRMNSMIKIDKVKSVDEHIVVVELDWLIKKMREENMT